MATVLLPEWAEQRAVLLTWPREDGDFAQWHEAVERTFIQLVVTIARFEDVIVSTIGEPEKLRRRLILEGAVGARVRVHQAPSNDVWARDHGPITVLRDGQLVHLDFIFNGWGGKFAAEDDDRLTRRLAEQQVWEAPVESIDFVLEGGAIESDGQGTLLTTERCLLAATRNPRIPKAQIEARLREWFGLKRVLWLQHGDLLGDDTDGHIDTLARFCDAKTLAYQACDDRSDAHFGALRAMEEELQALRRVDGQPYRLISLPLPAPVHDETGRRLPAGYANFLIINRAVLVPTYGDAMDRIALERLRPAFPEREVIGIDCRALIQQYGSLHCVSMQIPRGLSS